MNSKTWPAEAEFAEQSIELSRGDRLYLYSDGIPETMNADMSEFGKKRLVESVTSHRGLALNDSLKRLESDLTNWRRSEHFDDDVSALALDICG